MNVSDVSDNLRQSYGTKWKVTFRQSNRSTIVMKMQRASRITALCSGIFLAAMVLATSGFACISASSGGGMSSMEMASSAASAAGELTTAAVPETNPENNGAPCRFPWAPDGCQSMTPCAPAAVLSPSACADASGPRPQTVVVATALMPSSAIQAPELPPPRA